MNHKDLVTLANAIQTIRPDWNQSGIIAQLSILQNNWNRTDADMFAHAMATAADPAARNPGAFNATRPANTPVSPYDPDPLDKQPLCYICGNTKPKCEWRQDWEISHGVPDPHVFETAQQAEANAMPITAERKAAIMNQIRGLLKNVNDQPGMAHAVQAEKAKAPK